MYGQLGTGDATISNVGSATSSNLNPEEMNKEGIDNYYPYWYKGKENADESHDKNDLVELFSKFEKSHTLNDIKNVFNIDDFLKAMALDYIVNNVNNYLYKADNYFLFFNQEKNTCNYHEGYYNYPFNLTVNQEDYYSL